jgi:hypothetical protein
LSQSSEENDPSLLIFPSNGLYSFFFFFHWNFTENSFKFDI